MAYYITDECIGCMACLTNCPVDAITGDRNMLHIIDPNICIDCSACGMVCPVEAIRDQFGEVCKFIRRPTHRPIAVIYEELCSGCDFCVHICPWECLELKDPETGEHAESFFGICELVKPKDCVGCKLCEEVCIKDAIRIESPVLVELAEAAEAAD